MKKLMLWVIAATLICSLGVFTSSQLMTTLQNLEGKRRFLPMISNHFM